MPEAAGASPVYTFRSNLFRPERCFTLRPDGLLVESPGHRALIPYREIGSVQLYQVDIKATGPVDRCEVRAHGRTIRLQSAHVLGPANLQDRRTSYEPFVWRLILRIVDAHPGVRVMVGTPWPNKLGRAFTLFLLVAGGLGGLALLFTGDWVGVWLIAAALGQFADGGDDAEPAAIAPDEHRHACRLIRLSQPAGRLTIPLPPKERSPTMAGAVCPTLAKVYYGIMNLRNADAMERPLVLRHASTEYPTNAAAAVSIKADNWVCGWAAPPVAAVFLGVLVALFDAVILEKCRPAQP